MTDTKEDLIEALASATTDDMREVFTGVLSHIVETRKASGHQHAYEGVKVHTKPKPFTAMVKSLADAASEWADLN